MCSSLHFAFQVVSENNRDELSIILAGYEDDMNEKFFSYNEGKKSRLSCELVSVIPTFDHW